MYLVPLPAAFLPKRSSKPSSAERAALAVFYISISREGHTPLWSTSLTIRSLGCSLPCVKAMNVALELYSPSTLELCSWLRHFRLRVLSASRRVVCYVCCRP